MAAKHSRAVRSLTAGAVLALLAACTLEPRYHQPALPVANQWPIPATSTPVPATAGSAASPGTPDKTMNVADIGWRDFFADPKLQQLIAHALANNRDLRVAVLNVERARAEYHVQRADLLPSINASGSYTKSKIPPALSGFSTPINESYYQVGVGVSAFEIDLFGRVRSLSRAALQQYFAQEEARRSAQLTLIAEVANAYLSVAADRTLESLAQDTLKSQEDSYELTRQRHDSGAVSGLDLAQARTTVESARADAARYDGNVAQDVDALTLLVGATVDPATLPQNFDANVIGIDALPADLPSAVLLRRPDVLQAEHTLRSANANIGAARAAFFPTISLTADVGAASAQLSNLFKSGSESWSFAPQVSVPIFQGGRLIAGLGVARADRDIALAQYEKAIQSSFREVADALALTATLDRQRQAQQALVDATSEAYQLSQQRYKTGRDSYLTALDAQRSYYSAQQGLIATRLAEQNNRVTLYKALGGGWQEHSRP